MNLLRENTLRTCPAFVWNINKIKVPYQTLRHLKLWRKLAEKKTNSLFSPKLKIFHMQSVMASERNLKCMYLYLLSLFIYALGAVILKATSKDQLTQNVDQGSNK